MEGIATFVIISYLQINLCKQLVDKTNKIQRSRYPSVVIHFNFHAYQLSTFTQLQSIKFGNKCLNNSGP